MICVTSISPGHKNFDSQLRAIESWRSHGYRVVSLNSNEEIEKLQLGFKEVDFIETARTNEVLFGKPYVIISAIIDHLKTRPEEHFLILNSDIIVNDEMGFTPTIRDISEKGIVIMNRRDFNDDMKDSKVYEMGFDGFFINKKWLNIFPQSILCLGQCFWDFWLPFQAVLAGVTIFKLNEPYLYHQRHAIQYSTADWKSTGEIFRGEAGRMDKNIYGFKDVQRVSAYVYNKIQLNLK